MKKIAALVLALVLALSCVSALAESVYVGNTVWCSPGYENDCYNGDAYVLTLNDDGTYKLVHNTSIIQVSYKVVTTWTYFVTGTYEVTGEEDGVLEVALHGTDVTYVMNGAVTTLAEDAELLEDYVEMTVECDNDALSVTVL